MSMGKRSFAFVDEHCKEANRSRPRDDKAAGLHAFDGNSVAIIYLIYHRVASQRASQPAHRWQKFPAQPVAAAAAYIHSGDGQITGF